MLKRPPIWLWILVMLAALALRLPGVSWGFGMTGSAFTQFHPDENPGCIVPMTNPSYLKAKSNNRERGIQFQCRVLGAIAKPALEAAGKKFEQPQQIVVGRVYGVVCGLLSILVLARLARELSGENDTAASWGALATAFGVATCGMHQVTSFFARGQIQGTLCFFLAILSAVISVSREGKREHAWVFATGFVTGFGVATRWTVALAPLVLLLVICRRQVLLRVPIVAIGAVAGFFIASGFQWTPEQVQSFVRSQSAQLLQMKRTVGPHVMVLAALVATFAGTGLVTWLAGSWGLVGRANEAMKTLRDEVRSRPRRLTRGYLWSKLVDLRALIGNRWSLFLAPLFTQLALLSLLSTYDPRYADFFPPAIAVLAGVAVSHAVRAGRLQHRIWQLGTAAGAAYQLIYATGMLHRYVFDARYAENAMLVDHVPKGATVFRDWYIEDAPGFLERDTRKRNPWDCEWLMVSDLHALRYLTRSTTFVVLGGPTSCKEIFNCEGEKVRAFYQQLYAGKSDYDLVSHSRSAVWTPEMMLFRHLAGTRWLFTADIRLYHRRPPATR
jgi:hypothetical protein